MAQKRSFEDWKNVVEHYLGQLCGMSSMDLPDCDYWSWWNDGVSPLTAARRAIRDAF